MRQLTNRDRIRELMRALGVRADQTARVYFTGGADSGFDRLAGGHDRRGHSNLPGVRSIASGHSPFEGRTPDEY